MAAAALALEGLRWATGFALLWSVPRCRDRDVVGGQPVTVVIPARNEEASLPVLLQSLSNQDADDIDVIVVDDHSADRTAAVAESAGATVIAAPPLRPGFNGKAAACAAGA